MEILCWALPIQGLGIFILPLIGAPSSHLWLLWNLWFRFTFMFALMSLTFVTLNIRCSVLLSAFPPGLVVVVMLPLGWFSWPLHQTWEESGEEIRISFPKPSFLLVTATEALLCCLKLLGQLLNCWNTFQGVGKSILLLSNSFCVLVRMLH